MSELELEKSIVADEHQLEKREKGVKLSSWWRSSSGKVL